MGTRVTSVILAVLAALIAGCGGGTVVEPPANSFDQLQVQIDQLVAPPGVDLGSWDQLKQELSLNLRMHHAERSVAAAPGTDGSKATDLLFSGPAGGQLTFTWSYRNQGDYDLNGEVNISDITPIALFFQTNSASPDWASARVVDGDSNLEVNIADITPIAINYSATVTGYHLQSTTTPDNEQSWQQVAEIAFSAGVKPPAGGYPAFTVSTPEPAQGTTFRVVPYHDNSQTVDTGIASNHRTYGTSPAVATLLDEAQDSLLTGDGVAARDSFEQAIALAPDNPTANFGLAFLELMSEANDVVQFLDEQNDAVFKNIAFQPVNTLLTPITRGELWHSLVRISKDKQSSDFLVQDLTYEEIRAEMITIIDVLKSITDRLDLSLETMPALWTLTILEDWNDAAAGTIVLETPDVMTLSAGLDLAVGFLNLSLAYSGGSVGITQVDTGGGDYEIQITGLVDDPPEIVDVNEDGFIDMAEAALSLPVPADALVLNPDGEMRLVAMTTYMHRALGKAVEAIELYLAKGTLTDHWAFSMEQAEFDEFADYWETYADDYAHILVDMWEGPVTLTISPQLLSDFPDLADKPGADFSITVNCAAFFQNLPNDLRDLPMRWAWVEEWGEYRMEVPPIFADAFSDPTILGLFPDGLTQEQYDMLWPESP